MIWSWLRHDFSAGPVSQVPPSWYNGVAWFISMLRVEGEGELDRSGEVPVIRLHPSGSNGMGGGSRKYLWDLFMLTSGQTDYAANRVFVRIDPDYSVCINKQWLTVNTTTGTKRTGSYGTAISFDLSAESILYMTLDWGGGASLDVGTPPDSVDTGEVYPMWRVAWSNGAPNLSNSVALWGALHETLSS